jgi:hypothetical protein
MAINIRWNMEGFEELRKVAPVRNLAKDIAEDIARTASENGRVKGYKVTPLLLEDPRGAVSVMATGHARNHNAKTHALIKALDTNRRLD